MKLEFWHCVTQCANSKTFLTAHGKKIDTSANVVLFSVNQKATARSC